LKVSCGSVSFFLPFSSYHEGLVDDASDVVEVGAESIRLVGVLRLLRFVDFRSELFIRFHIIICAVVGNALFCKVSCGSVFFFLPFSSYHERLVDDASDVKNEEVLRECQLYFVILLLILPSYHIGEGEGERLELLSAAVHEVAEEDEVLCRRIAGRLEDL